MERRKFIKGSTGLGLAALGLRNSVGNHPLLRESAVRPPKLSGPRAPVFIYDNWSAYDELSDNVFLTEKLSLRELDEIIRWKRNGVQIDYYVMDAFWFDKWGGYRTWNKEHWPQGPDKWLAQCKANHIHPGMWFSTNLIATHSGRFLEVIPEWQDSLGTDPNIMCLFRGGYLPHLAGSLQHWYDRGVRAFKFDFAYFEAVTPADKDKYTPEEVKEKNKTAFMQMLQSFRQKNPDVLITGYNGFGGDMENTFTPFDDKRVDPRWLETFDTLYSGDPRFSDTPMMNIWRSADNYSDHQVSAYQAYGLPIRRIDNCAFMIGTTGTCYYRGTHCWKGMLILELARGGWVNVYHGNLELLSDPDAQWFAKVQRVYHRLQQLDSTSPLGEIPGKGKPYGFKSLTPKGAVLTVVNPSQEMATIDLPVSASWTGKIMYADGGYLPEIQGNRLKLGAEQLVVAGFGELADLPQSQFQELYHFGIDDTIQIPMAIDALDASFAPTLENHTEAQLIPPAGKWLRILFQQFDPSGLPYRTWGGAPPDGKKMDTLLKIQVKQGGKTIPLRLEYDQMIWSGLSWVAAEVNPSDLNPAQPLNIRCITMEQKPMQLRARVYAVRYSA
jgi:hypothetical protein